MAEMRGGARTGSAACYCESVRRKLTYVNEDLGGYPKYPKQMNAIRQIICEFFSISPEIHSMHTISHFITSLNENLLLIWEEMV
jgi:hypothetical protein